MRIHSIILLGLCCTMTLAQDRVPEARLLCLKKVLNRYLVENRDVSIDYELYNVGDATAVDVQLKDRTFPPTDFDVVSGSLEATFPKILPNTNITHSVVVRPNKYGMFNFTAAEVEYKLSDAANAEVRHSLTTEPGQGGIMPEVEFERRFSPHYLDWVVFLLLCMPSLLVPFLLYNSSKSKYENLAKKAK